MSDRERDDAVRRAANLEDRTVVGGAPTGGGSTMASSGAYDTPGGGDLGGPGFRDPGDSAGDLRPESANTGGEGDTSDLDREAAERLAQQVFSGDAAAAAGTGRDQDLSGQGGANPLQDQLRAHAAAQGRGDADEAQGLLDKTRAQTDISGDPNNDNL